MANPTTNYGWQMPTPTDLVTDLPADFEVFGQAVDTSLLGLKGGTTGQVLSKTSGTDMAFTWIPAATGGLTLISTNAFSAVSTKQVTGCFSATYNNYLVLFEVTAGTADASLKLRFSVSGVDNTTTNYFFASNGIRPTGAAAPLTTNGAGTLDIGRINNNSTQTQKYHLDIFKPFTAAATGISAIGYAQDVTAGIAINGGGNFNAANSFDGITFYPTGGAMTGTITVYGYQS